jgi:hypothetical protein
MFKKKKLTGQSKIINEEQKEEEEDPQHSRRCNIWSELSESIHAQKA